MKVIRWMAMSVMVSLTCPGIGESQIPRELEPSLKTFQVVSTPMPEFRRVVYYTAFPDSGGDLVRGIGHSSWVRAWFPQMEPMVPKFLKSDERVRMDFNVYADTVREEGDSVLKAAANLKQSLTGLDTLVRGRVLDLLIEYTDAVKAARVARIRYVMATRKADEAKFLVEATDADAEECNQLLERARLEADQASIRANIRKGQAFLRAVGKAIDAMAGGPTAVAGYLIGEAKALTAQAAEEIIIEAFYSAASERLYAISVKIEAIDKSLADLKCKKQAAMLKAAKLNLENAITDALLAFGDILEHRAKAWITVDKLADTGRSLPFFKRLQTYNAQANLMGGQMFDAVSSHLDLLAREPLSRGELLLSYVDEDIQVVERERAKRDPQGTWLSNAKALKAYFTEYARWHRGEVKRGLTVLEDLREGGHLDFVDRILARAARDLGVTVSYGDIVR
jgi:hypothetical protein